MSEERLSGALQENILTALVFDDKNAKLMRAALTPQLFGNALHREVAGVAIDFIDQYGEAIKEHLPDQLEHLLNGDDRRKAEGYRNLLDNLYQSRDTVNSEYVMSELHKFVRLQRFKSGLVSAVELVQDGKLDEAEVTMTKAMNSQSVAFEPGLSLSNAEDIGSVLDQPEEEGFQLGIPELDRRGLYPRRKTLTLFIAPRGKGKSWFITHCAKQAMLQRWSVVVITLEMSERSYAARFLQAFFSLGRREGAAKVTQFERDRGGNLTDMLRKTVERWALKDPDIRVKLMPRAKKEFARRAPMRIKQFPTHSMTIEQLEAYLDGLERFEGVTPDMLAVDYPDLMQLDSKNLRLELGAAIARIRGIAVKRNAAAVVVSQGNRDAEKAETVTGDMAAEDISKLATADLVFTYSQTAAEYALGLGRLLVEKARDEESKFSLLLTQAYALGQFCLDSILLRTNYWDILDDNSEDTGARRRPAREEREDDAPRTRRKAPSRRRNDEGRD